MAPFPLLSWELLFFRTYTSCCDELPSGTHFVTVFRQSIIILLDTPIARQACVCTSKSWNLRTSFFFHLFTRIFWQLSELRDLSIGIYETCLGWRYYTYLTGFRQIDVRTSEFGLRFITSAWWRIYSFSCLFARYNNISFLSFSSPPPFSLRNLLGEIFGRSYRRLLLDDWSGWTNGLNKKIDGLYICIVEELIATFWKFIVILHQRMRMRRRSWKTVQTIILL